VEFAFQYAGKTGLDSIDFIHVLEYHDQEIPLHSEFAARFDTDKVKQDVLNVIKKAVQKTGSSLAQRLEVARLLDAGYTYPQIAQQTGASTATISRVKKFLEYGADGYRTVLDRIRK